MVRQFSLVLCLLMATNGLANAGLDQHGKWDEVIAIYKFENTKDSGPRRFHGDLYDGASIVNNGKEGKCLRLEEDSNFLVVNDLFLGITGNFSIVGWLKTQSMQNQKSIDITVASKEDNGDFSMISFSIEITSIIAFIGDAEDDESDGVTSEIPNIANDKWNHIAFSLTEDFYRIFLNGEVIAEEQNHGYIGFVGNNTLVLIDSDSNGVHYIDEVGFFETGFSPYEVKGLYKDGLTKFLEIMPVNPQGRLATTWADMKR